MSLVLYTEPRLLVGQDGILRPIGNRPRSPRSFLRAGVACDRLSLEPTLLSGRGGIEEKVA